MEKNIVKIQAWWRGVFYRRSTLPVSILYIKTYMDNIKIKCCKLSSDGRVNSNIDETEINKQLKMKFGYRIIIPKQNKRFWYDFLIKDYKRGWLPVNIKSIDINKNSACNIGGFSLLCWSLCDYDMKLDHTYSNRETSKIFLNCVKNKKYQKTMRDYYFLVIDKNTQETIVNSVRGLTLLTPNLNNLPFQVNWKKNKCFQYKTIENTVKQIKYIIQKPKPNWAEMFLTEFRKID
jgi:hypothetical protein